MNAHKSILEFDDALPLVHLSAVTAQGSLLDPPNREGTTRLLLRLMRRSVMGMTTEELDECFDTLGGTLGPEINRSISGFHGGVISRSKSEFLELAARVLTSPNFSEDEFERLRGEALADFQDSLDNDSVLARRAFTRHLFVGHPYSRLSGGTPQSLSRIELDDLVSLYAQLFQQNALTFALSGDVTESELNGWAQMVNQRLAHSAGKTPAPLDPEIPSGRRLVFVDKPERTQTQIIIGGLGTHPNDDDHTALYLGHVIFGGTFSSRLSREVRGKRGWSYGASSSLPFDRRRQSFSMWTFPQSSDAANCIRLEIELFQELIEKGVTARELRNAKKYLANSHVFSVDTASKRASLALDEHVYGLPPGYFEHHLERVAALSVDDVNDALKRRFSAENLLVCMVGTSSEILVDVQRAIAGLSSTDVVAFNETA
jgi:zinc protease